MNSLLQTRIASPLRSETQKATSVSEWGAEIAGGSSPRPSRPEGRGRIAWLVGRGRNHVPKQVRDASKWTRMDTNGDVACGG